VDDAQDLTQAFFAHLLERNAIGAANQERGRFRAFLLTSCRNFLANEWEKASAQKRGGKRTVLSLDFERGEERYQLEPVDHLTPEVLYERQWALTLLDRTLQLLRDEFIKDGKTAQFAVLKPFLGGESESTSYADVAHQLHVSEGAARVIIHRLRRRYRDLLRQEIAQTVAHEEEVSDEIRGLFAALER
jgi:RNA polymerase sigma-70 factor (ECF subfamily)